MRSVKITRIIMILGVILIIAALIITVFPLVIQQIASSKNIEILKHMELLLPEVRAGVYDDRIDVDMPFAEIDGMNFVGMIEVPLHDVKLPIYASWDSSKVACFPCRYMGSIYDGSLIIGGSDGADQFDFSKTISIGDAVLVTDMSGARYSYKVTWVELTDDVSTEHLASLEADLVLFVRNSYSLDYAVVSCDKYGK